VALHRAAVVDKDLVLAQKLNRELAPLANFLVEFGLSVACKAGLELIGRPCGAPRRPLLPLPAPAKKRLQSILAELGS
jgi:4-hydroxy-tetrahydrodipicolinate synthase